ncbi:MAG: hypothetical protein HY660_09690 [Armatimonadetes bacterium]|nr:hypothetical protein [Armatimonadota bacterium]
MATEPMSHADVVLSPSELVLLYADQFCEKPGWGEFEFELPTGKGKVKPEQLAEALLAGAILASEQAGNLRLRVQEKRGFLGRRSKELLAEAGDATARWPEHTLESQVRPLVEAQPLKVSALIAGLLKETTGSGWTQAITLVQNGLLARGLLEIEEVKQRALLGTKTTERHRISERTAQFLTDCPVDPVKRLISECQQSHAEVWKLLQEEVKSGLRARTESDDSYPADYSPS